MNFEHMPELRWIFGYPLALALVIVAYLGLYGLQTPRLDLIGTIPVGRAQHVQRWRTTAEKGAGRAEWCADAYADLNNPRTASS
ncbi:hypothetical protein [Saccharopolyspora elongata]|uniref:Uncharacterized protein n=1 Tax=Saccharopolyspora elongata TaxID=2530387 RepID=A0A4R4YBW4_9PSEU|nr:hypothetical protein [Saccharopolyspora elongata]TDD41279.1 hypothetical protein E1288_33260 [Saccharopolyspora elongata]